MTEGAWIFLSHSHKDFDRVSSVRNVLEGHGHHPLMFFLKCLGDDDEIDGLIRREISARSWFILCESANTKISKWVQAEVQIIKGLPIKTYTEIDLDDPHLDVESELFSITRKASVFLSYARDDRVFAERMGAELKSHDFGVFSDLELQAGEDWRVRMESELENAALRGAILMLLSAESVRSQWQQRALNPSGGRKISCWSSPERHKSKIRDLQGFIGDVNLTRVFLLKNLNSAEARNQRLKH